MTLLCCVLSVFATARAQEIIDVDPADGGNADDVGTGDDTSPDRPLPSQATGPGDPGPPVFSLASTCSDMHACLKIHPVRGKTCHTDDSITLEVTNACKRPVAVGICIEQPGGAWSCNILPKLAGNQTNKKTFNACHGTGTFRALASAAADQAKQPCFLNVQNAGAGNLLPGPYLGVCARVKMCCRALQTLPGADALAEACDALDALPDNVGVEACSEILNVMRRETGKMAGTPQVCH